MFSKPGHWLVVILCGLFSAILHAEPVISTQPAASAVVSGNNAALRVSATGDTLTYQWFAGNAGDTASPVAGATGPLLVSPPLRASSSFWVRVTDATGSTDSQAAVVAANPPAACRLMAVGINYDGQLGDGTATYRVSPVTVAGDAIEVSAGTAHSMFITSDGTLWGMGGNVYGQLGDGTNIERRVPKEIASSVVQVSLRGSQSHFLKEDGSLWAMGANNSGQLGDGSSYNRALPVQIATEVEQVTAGFNCSFILKTDGSLFATGFNGYGKFGDGTTISRNVPIQVATGVASVAAGVDHSFFLKTDGTLWAVGFNGKGRLGDGTTTDRLSPVQVATGVVSVAAGYEHSLFLKSDATLWAVGNNNYGQLGDGTTTNRSVPVMVASQVKWVRGGGYYTLFGRTDDTLWASGRNNASQLADSTTTNRSTPFQSATQIAGAAAGDSHTLFLDLAPCIANQPADVAVAANGSATLSIVSNSRGPLSYQWYLGLSGDTTQPVAGEESASFSNPINPNDQSYWARITSPYGSVDSRSVLVKVVEPPEILGLSPAQEVSRNSSAALDATVSGEWLFLQWFEGASGDISKPVTGATSAKLVTPPLRSSTSFWLRVSNGAGTLQSAAVPVTLVEPLPNRLFTVGKNDSGQLGDGTTTDNGTPFLISSEVTQTSASTNHSLFIHSDGSLWAVGSNSKGQLGDGTTTTRTIPVPIAQNVVSVSAGGSHSLFIKSNGTLWAMGDGSYGQLGDGANFSQSTPVQIAQNVIVASAGEFHSLFLKTDGTLWAMGYNFSAQVGDGTTTSRSTPVQIAENVVSASAGYSFTLFVKTDGSLWAAGYNGEGRFADGTTGSVSPRQVASAVARVSAGNLQSLIVKLDGSLWITSSTGPTQIAQDVIDVSAGTSFNLFRKTDHSLWGVGANSSGQLADRTTSDRATPVLVRQSVGLIDAGSSHTLFGDLLPFLTAQPADTGVPPGGSTTLAVSANGPAPLTYQWYSGESGDTSSPISGAVSTSFQTPPAGATATYWVRVSSPYGGIDSRAATVLRLTAPAITTQPAGQSPAEGESAALTVVANGAYMTYQWYQGISGDTSNPIPVATGPLLITRPSDSASYWVRVSNAAASTDSQATTVTPGPAVPARLLVTGNNASGQLGTGTDSNVKSSSLLATRVIQAAGGPYHSLFVREDGTLWATGLNNDGQLGDGSTSGHFIPEKIATQVTLAAAGGSHSLFVKSDGSLWGMGANSYGQLGDDTITSRLNPIQIATSVSGIATGKSHSLFVKSDGSLWAMGENAAGQLGDGTTTRKNTPIFVANSVSRVAAGTSHSLFLKNDGTLWGMGANSSGQLGDGTTTNRSIPIQIASGVAFMSAGDASSLFITADGSLWATGSNTYGQLGTGDTSSVSSPVKVAEAVKSASVGTYFSLFLKTDNSVWAMGMNTYGQFGDGTTSSHSSPVQVAVAGASIAAGGNHSLIRDLLPAIESEPVDMNVQSGATPTLTASASGPVPLSYQWYAGSRGNTANPMTGANSASFQTPPAVGSASYWLRATNPYGSADSRTAVVLAVIPQPKITTQPFAATIKEGANTRFRVSASGGGLSYQWYRGQTGDINSPISGGTDSLFVTPLLFSSANYWVRITNPAGFKDSATVAATVTARVPGTLQAVGSAEFGQLGTGAMASNYQPAPIATGVAKVAMGNFHTLILKTDGSLWATGRNNNRQLGDGTTLSRIKPIPITTGVTSIAAGPDFSAWVKNDGTLWLASSTSTVPKQISTGVSTVWASSSSVYLLKTNGTLYRREIYTQSAEKFLSSDVVSAAAAGLSNYGSDLDHYLYIKTDGSLWGAGNNQFSPLGNANNSSFNFQIYAPAKLASNVVRVATGPIISNYVKSDGTLWTMGNSYFGQVADESLGSANPFPVCIATGVNDVTTGVFHTLVLKTDGSLCVLGANSRGELGDGTASQRNETVRIAQHITQFAAGLNASAFVTADGMLWGCGSNMEGQLGDITPPSGSVSARVADDVISISAGHSHSLFITSDGTLKATGANSFGQLGDGTQITRSTPEVTASGVAIAYAGKNHSLYVKNDGTLWATGRNVEGQLGDGTTINRSYPVQIASDVISAAAGGNHSLFVKSDGSMWTMGGNDYGQLGDGSEANQSTPAQIASSVVAVAAGENFSLFLKADGSLWSTGANGSGQLGTGNTDRRYVPVRVGTGITSINAGASFAQYMDQYGSLRGMGDNQSGQLGDGTTTSRSLPVQIPPSATSFSAGYYHSLFLQSSGKLLAVGKNDSYQLGDGTTTSRSTAVQVASNVIAASAGGSHSLWITSDAGTAVTAIASHPASGSIASGGTATLSVHAVGEGVISYQWFVGLSGDATQPVSGATSADFTTPAIAADAIFWVRATSSSGTADSRSARIGVRSTPSIITQASIAGYLPSGGVRLTVTGSEETDDYQWFRGPTGDISQPLPEATTASVLTLPVNATTNFWVRLSNPLGSIDSESVIVVKAPVRGRNLQAAGESYGSTISQLAGAVTFASTGTVHSLFVKTSGTLWGIGANDQGQLGDGTTNATQLPVKIANDVATAAAGSSHSLFVKNDGTLWAMGSNSFGQLGIGSTASTTTPTFVAAGVASVAAAYDSSYIVKTDGTLWAMGSNNDGKLGDGTGLHLKSPVQIATDVAMVAAGRDHALFLKTDGSLWGMGDNSRWGQLGLPNAAYPSPARIAEGVVSIAAGDNHSLFVTSDGVLHSMGKNDYGQLGIGATERDWTSLRSQFPRFIAPPRIVADRVIEAAAGTNHSLWTTTYGSLWATGSNSAGQLCNGSSTTTLKPPARALSDTGFVGAGGNDSLILTTTAAVEPPAILAHPAAVFTIHDATATFTVSAIGGGTLAYQWYAGETGDTTSPIPDANSASFTTPPLSATSTVWVKISNAAAWAESRSATAIIGGTTGYHQWANSKFLDAADLAPTADPDGDQRSNLLEYATGSHPGQPDTSPPGIASKLGTTAIFRLQLRGDPGLHLTCHLSPDLATWQSIGLVFSNGTWTTTDPALQITAVPGEDMLFDLTLTYPDAPDHLFLTIGADMSSPP